MNTQAERQVLAWLVLLGAGCAADVLNPADHDPPLGWEVSPPTPPPATPPEEPPPPIGEPDACAAPCAPAPAFSCLALAGCDNAASAEERCVYGAAPARTPCLLEGDETGLCDGERCVECIDAADCAGMRDNAAGCFSFACVAGACAATLHHDGVDGFLVAPSLTDELLIGHQGRPMKAVWDGDNFMVWTSVDQGMVGRRINPAGHLVPGDLVLDPLTADLDVVRYSDANGQTVVRYMALTVEPAATSPFGYQYIGGYQFTQTGERLGAKINAIVATGNVCPSGDALVYPRIAGSGSSFLAVAGSQYCAETHGFVQNLATGAKAPVYFNVVMYRFRYARPYAAPGKFLLETEDKSEAGGGNQIGGAFINAAATSGNSPTAYTKALVPPPDAPAACCWYHHTAIWGSDSYLQLYSLGGNGLRARRLGSDRALGAETLIPGADYNPSMLEVQVGFDGTNFLVVSQNIGEALPAYRLSPDGELLDLSPIALTPDADGTEQHVVLAGDRAGRYLVAYQKADGNVYARLFSTCP